MRVGEEQTIPCDILNCGWLDGVIIVALLLTTPVLCDEGDATVVLANVLAGDNIKAIVQRYL